MTDAEYLIGFESVARRLLADVDTKASRAVFRDIELAQRAVERTHGEVAQHHLERALMEIGDLGRTGKLVPAWAESLQRIGRWIAEGL
jgi:hypothetical protein